MQAEDPDARLDRHALVLAVWMPVGFGALALFHHGFGAGGVIWLAGGFGALLAGFGAHVIVNAVLGTGFTPREVALGLFLTLLALLALVVATLLVEGFAERYFLALTAGLAALGAAVVLYMIIRHGPRRAFEAFDVARQNNRRPANLLPHRGGRK
jgi:hypothetical protein